MCYDSTLSPIKKLNRNPTEIEAPKARFVLHVFPRKTDKDGITTIAKFNKKKHKISLLTNVAHSNVSERGFTVSPLITDYANHFLNGFWTKISRHI